MSTDAAQSAACSDDLLLTYRLQLPVFAPGASILAHALDFGKPVKDTTRKLSVSAPLPEHQRGADFPVLVVDAVVTAPTARALRIAVHGLCEHMELALRTLEMFGPAQHAATGGASTGVSPTTAGTSDNIVWKPAATATATTTDPQHQQPHQMLGMGVPSASSSSFGVGGGGESAMGAAVPSTNLGEDAETELHL